MLTQALKWSAPWQSVMLQRHDESVSSTSAIIPAPSVVQTVPMGWYVLNQCHGNRD